MSVSLLGDATPVVDAVSTMLDGVFGHVRAVCDDLRACFDRCGDDAVTRRDLASLQPRLHAALGHSGGLLRGTGVVLAPARLMDARLWIDWWVIDREGIVHPTYFEFDERSLDYYDYTRAEWYLSPESGTLLSLVGPYVDFNGIDDYIVTATSPMLVDGQFVGVAGADLAVDEIERRLNAANRSFGVELVVTNASNRIVASMSARHVAGALLPAEANAQRFTVSGLPWSVVVLNQRSPG